MISDLVTRLIEAGTPPAIAAQIITEAFVAGATSTGIPPDSTAEKRRAYDRERKRRSTGIPPESTGIPQRASTLKTSKESKSRRKHQIPPEWKPSERHYASAAERGISKSAVDAKAEDMRLWAGSNGALKADWDLTFYRFLKDLRPDFVTSEPVEMIDWENTISFFKKTGKWSRWAGPEPGQIGCLAPPEILQKHGVAA